MAKRCSIHADRPAASFCHSCKQDFCGECLVAGRVYYYCRAEACQAELAAEGAEGPVTGVTSGQAPKWARRFWPDVTDGASATSAARQAFWAAVFVAGATALFSILAIAGTPLRGIGGWAMVDAVLFATIAVGIRRMSRLAAIAGLLLYIAEVATSFSGGGLRNPVLTAVFVLAFANGVRGTSAYAAHRRAGHVVRVRGAG